jgi:flagellar motor protein MotB
MGPVSASRTRSTPAVQARSARWAVSFADLCLLLLGFFILLQARPDNHQLAKGFRASFAPTRPLVEAPAATLFQPGEAMLSPSGQYFVSDFRARAGTRKILIASSGTDRRSARFDGWELAAARAAALARALASQGVPEARITLQMDRTNGGQQQLSLEAR